MAKNPPPPPTVAPWVAAPTPGPAAEVRIVDPAHMDPEQEVEDFLDEVTREAPPPAAAADASQGPGHAREPRFTPAPAPRSAAPPHTAEPAPNAYHARGTISGVFGEVVWTEDSEAHIARHGVTPLEVEQALYARPRLTAPGREGVTEVLGTSDAGRHLLIVVTESADGRDFVVTARDMTDTEKRLFREKGR